METSWRRRGHEAIVNGRHSTASATPDEPEMRPGTRAHHS